jgi:quercetin dioxygenase-like cupin family protein
MNDFSMAALAARTVRYSDLRPCLNAFIDTRSPGSEAKENFTIIGPGVSENPDQFVHIAEPHGFNIGGARQPPGCVNSQHSHTSAEVFVVHTGQWRFDLGETGQDAQVQCGPGDVISLPTGMFRGFTNVGSASGFLWAVLGGDDPGRVTWAPQVFDMAADYGLVLLENGSLVDTAAGQPLPAGAVPMPRTSAAQVAAMRVMTDADAAAIVARAAPAGNATDITPIIGAGAPLDWPHGFAMDRIDIAAGDSIDFDVSDADVLFIHDGSIVLEALDSTVELAAGDTISLPAGMAVHIASDAGATAFLVSRE